MDPEPVPLPVDVVVVHHGSARDLRRAIERAVGPGVRSVTVVNNGGDDPEAALEHSPVPTTVIQPGANLGFAAGFGVAARLGDAPYVASITSDVDCDPGYLATLVDHLDAHPRVAAASGVLRLPDGRVDSTGISLTTAAWATDRDRHLPAGDADLTDPFGVSGAAAVLRRAALDDVGGLWDQLFVWWEDVEWAWRARRGGWTFATVAAATAVHARGADTADADLVEGESWRNRLASIARHGPPAATPSSRLATAAVTTVVGSRLALRHPRALRGTLRAVRAGRAARRADAAVGVPHHGIAPLSPHPWRRWLLDQSGRGTTGTDRTTPGGVT